MGNWTEFKGKFSIKPPLTSNEIETANKCYEDANRNMWLQKPNAEFTTYHGNANWFGCWSVASKGDEITLSLTSEFDRLYEGKGYLRYLIEHGIKKTGSKVNGEVVFLNEYCSFGILGVDNNEVYTVGYLKEEDYLKLVDDSDQEDGEFTFTINNIPKVIDDISLLPVTFRYDIAQKINASTEFKGFLVIDKIVNLEIYHMTRQNEQEQRKERENQIGEDNKKYDQKMKKELRELEVKIASELYQRKLFLIAEHNSDGTVGEKSSKNEWILSEDKQKLVWSGKKFIAAHHWLAFLINECFDVSGSLRWINEKNELGTLKVESVEMSYGRKNFLFIEFEGQKYLANISWSY